MLDLLYVVSMVAAGLATAAAILGFHVLKRNRSARLGLSVLAVPLFLCGLVTGGFLASVVAASVAMLWLSPARHWFAGTTPEPVPSSASTPAAAPAPPPAPTPHPRCPHRAPRRRRLPPPAWPAYAATQPPPWVPAPAPPPRRPTAVAAACAITWACCALAALMSLLLVGVLTADPEGLIAEMHRQNPTLVDQGVSDGALRSASWVTAVVCLVWAVVVRPARGAGVPAAALGRHRAGHLGRRSSGCSAWSAPSLSPPLVIPGLLAAATVALLLQSSAQRWLGRRDVPGAARGPGMMR